ncbi:hypothetical protein F2Q68_00024150 [Brassica cretica]|uniref:Uncharacterized protein n=1 Tax=Brassica cretica TaxID=69181 RepID=A0A8S9I8I7_BRACR|nr:hypothetical protein F2Q68_00024150 [Brassica cretica]
MAELKDGTTRAPIVQFLSCQRATELKPSLENPDHFETSAVIFNRFTRLQTVHWMDMVTKGVHNVIEFLSDDSPDMDMIGISDNFFSDNKPAAVNCIERHGSSLGRFKSHVSNIVFDEHSENILPSGEGDVGLAASFGPVCFGRQEAARLCTSQAELKDGTTRAPIVRFLSCQRATELKPSLENPDHFETSAVIFNRYHQDCGAMGMDMVTKGVHNVIEFLSDDSPDMDVIGISDNFFSDNKPAAVNCIEGYGSPSVLGDKVDEECAAADPPEDA